MPALANDSINRLLSLKSVRKQKELMFAGKIKAQNYTRAMRGEPQEPVPTAAELKEKFAAFDEEDEPAPLDIGRIRERPELSPARLDHKGH